MQRTSIVGNNKVMVALGDLTQTVADAYVVPQFHGAASFGGVGGAVARSGALKGLEAYEKAIDSNGPADFGTALITESGGGNSRFLLHVVSVGSQREDEYVTVRNGFHKALELAGENGLKTLAAPALGTGIIGQLTATQSAKAMFSALDHYSSNGGQPLEVSVVIFGDKAAFDSFVGVLEKGEFLSAKPEAGDRELDPIKWIDGMNADFAANKRAFG